MMASGPSRGLLVACAIIVHIGCNAAQVSLPFQCSFESDDLCGMTQRTDDDFDWTRQTGTTPSLDTGPSEALDGDYYIYIEASDHWNGDRAIIETPPIRYSGAVCVQFWYHMYTQSLPHMGRLVVFTERQGESNPLFDESSVNIRDKPWKYKQITVSAFTTGDKIAFLNEERDEQLGDMALDMIDIQGGSCNDDNECGANGGRGDCSHTCVNTPASYTCSCPTGYELEADRRTCRDINECATNGGKGDCGHQCDNWGGSYGCRCNSGYTLNGDDKSCDDIDECSANGGKGPCDGTCMNSEGSYKCSCPDGQYLRNDGTTCADVTPLPTATTTTTTTFRPTRPPFTIPSTTPPTTIPCTTPPTAIPPPNECLADHECDQLCHNTHEGYLCSCRDSFLLADDKRHCIECRDAYRRQLDASQAFTSLCPTIETYLNIPLTTCLINACADNVSVVTYASNVCTLKLCTGGDLQLERAPGSSGWDIYVLNTTWTGSRPEDASSFPLWQLLTGVFVGAAALGAIIAVVTVWVKKRIASGKGEGRAPYKNAKEITRHDTTAENTGTQPEVGVYDEVLVSHVQKTRRLNDDMVYNNAAFHTDGPYQELGPTDQRT